MKSLRTMWSSTDFGASELTRYASAVMCREARQGIFVLGILTLLLMAGLALLYYALGLGTAYQYTFGALALLALHVAVSARTISDIKVLYLLGMVPLAVSGLAFVLLAHRYGVFTATLFSTVVLLFIVVPLVPWGLREALFAVGVIYLIFTGSPVAKTTSNSRGSGSGWISLARATSLLVSPLIAETTTTSLVSGGFECGNPTGDALDALGRTPRSPTEFLDDQRQSCLEEVLEFYCKFITKVKIRLTLRSPAGGAFRHWHGLCCWHRMKFVTKENNSVGGTHRPQLVVVYQ